jgi:pyruvate dehydrogenase E1 component alpha subunit
VPAVFVLEDNGWAESTPESQHSPIRDLSERAKAFGMKAL